MLSIVRNHLNKNNKIHFRDVIIVLCVFIISLFKNMSSKTQKTQIMFDYLFNI